MRIKVNDWVFDIDLDSTMKHSFFLSSDHCTCAYCQNFYSAVDKAYPHLRSFMAQFGLSIEAVAELMPFEPTLYLASYRIFGRLVARGKELLTIDGSKISFSQLHSDQFIMEVGPLEIPWVLQEDMDEVMSPANTPEYLERMQRKWMEIADKSTFLS